MRNRISYILGLSALVVLGFATVALARTYNLQGTPVVPGAMGTIDAKVQKNGSNTELTVKVDHLARPTVLTPPANEYVVWIEPENGEAQNAGVLQVGDNEKGDLKVTTTASKFDVIVTAESAARTEKPSQRVVLRAHVNE